MRRLAAGAVVAVLLIAGCGSGEPPQWKVRGFDSEQECIDLHGGFPTDAARKFWCD